MNAATAKPKTRSSIAATMVVLSRSSRFVRTQPSNTCMAPSPLDLAQANSALAVVSVGSAAR